MFGDGRLSRFPVTLLPLPEGGALVIHQTGGVWMRDEPSTRGPNCTGLYIYGRGTFDVDTGTRLMEDYWCAEPMTPTHNPSRCTASCWRQLEYRGTPHGPWCALVQRDRSQDKQAAFCDVCDRAYLPDAKATVVARSAGSAVGGAPRRRARPR